MVEGPVLLHKDHDVLDVLDRPCADSRGDRGGPRDAGRQCGGRDGATRNLEEPSAVDGALASHAAMSAVPSEHKVTYSQAARGTLASARSRRSGRAEPPVSRCGTVLCFRAG